MERIMIEDLERYTFLSGLRFSPAGKTALLCATRMDLKANRYESSLWRLDMEGGGEGSWSALGYAQSGKSIPFCFIGDSTLLLPTRPEGEEKDYVDKGGWLTIFSRLPVAGGAPRRAFSVPLAGASALKARAGLYLLSCVHDCARPDIESMPHDERDEALKAWSEEGDYQVCDELPYCFDGRGYINKKRHRLYLYEEASGRLSAVTAPLFEVSASAVSPDGKRIAYAGVEYVGRTEPRHGAYLYNTETGAIRELLAPGTHYIADMAFMDSALVLAARPWNGFGSTPNSDLYTLDLASGELQLQISHASEDFGGNALSDCRLGGGTTFTVQDNVLYYTALSGCRNALYAWKRGEERACLIRSGYSVDFFAVHKEKILFVGCGSGRLQEVYTVENGKAGRIGDFNGSALEGRYLSQPEALSIANRDGLTIEGFVMRPFNYDETKTYPAVLEIHGGPRMAYSDHFFHEMQVLASMGYFVFYCNPRGSAGRGESFSNISGVRGTIDYHDLMDWTDAVLERYPSIDPERLGITGGSYGGYMTNWIIGHTRRFKAAVSCRSNANVPAMYGVGDRSAWSNPGSYGATPWDDIGLLWEESPFKYLPQIKTPTLFLHSMDDHRCPVVNSMQMYSGLMMHGVDTRMVLFRGESHGLSRSGAPRHRVRRLKELTGWMQKYLPPLRQTF